MGPRPHYDWSSTAALRLRIVSSSGNTSPRTFRAIGSRWLLLSASKWALMKRLAAMYSFSALVSCSESSTARPSQTGLPSPKSTSTSTRISGRLPAPLGAPAGFASDAHSNSDDAIRMEPTSRQRFETGCQQCSSTRDRSAERTIRGSMSTLPRRPGSTPSGRLPIRMSEAPIACGIGSFSAGSSLPLPPAAPSVTPSAPNAAPASSRQKSSPLLSVVAHRAIDGVSSAHTKASSPLSSKPTASSIALPPSAESRRDCSALPVAGIRRFPSSPTAFVQ
mmetsp:Transcript_38249/g.112005  ORF Transcript_38249/g.112005 Transcript_38249/m.112005 type:complete len:278 (-) Transcript_38249:131-964(-)